jgi:hypothetical protein
VLDKGAVDLALNTGVLDIGVLDGASDNGVLFALGESLRGTGTACCARARKIAEIQV